MPSDAWGLFSGPGSWVWACVGQLGDMEIEGTDLRWPETWEMALSSSSLTQALLGCPPPLLRKGGVCPALWSSHNSDWRTWERCLRVPFEASGRRGGGGVQMDHALSFPHPTTSGSIREAPFWLQNKTFNERISWFKNVRRTRRPGQCVSNCHLDPLMGHTICWIVLVKDILADVTNKPKM